MTAGRAGAVDDGVVDELVEGILTFVEKVVEPLEEEHAEALADPFRAAEPGGRKAPWVLELERQVRQASAEAGFYTCTLPVEMGGGGMGPLATFRLWEALYERFGGARRLPYWSLAHFATGPSGILAGVEGTRERELVEGLVRGDLGMCFGLSEPDAGSDAWALRTTATRDGDGWLLDGTKQWTTNGPYADVALVFAVTDRERARQRAGGVSAFLVPTDTPGFEVERVITLFGHAGGDEAILRLDGVRLPATSLVGTEGEGFRLALQAVNDGRLYNCARAIGLARWCLALATDYAKDRYAFGRPIADNQAIQWHLADSAIELYGARSAALDCARRLECGERAVKELSMAKVLATESASRAIDRCTQVLGAMGLTSEVGFYDAWQQVRVVRIAEGSAEILRRAIARRLLDGDLEL